MPVWGCAGVGSGERHLHGCSPSATLAETLGAWLVVAVRCWWGLPTAHALSRQGRRAQQHRVPRGV